jgi:hypothetical protein
MRTVVPPVTDAPIEATSETAPDEARLEGLARAHNLDGPLKRLREALAKNAEVDAAR